jgi:anti-sigma-K factor RskA
MDINAYIASGILELYVAGALSEQENQEVYQLTQQYPELLEEVKHIEASIVKLTAAVSPNDAKPSFDSIKKQINTTENSTKTIPQGKPKTPWFTYVGWAASLILAAGLLWMVNENNALKETIRVTEADKQSLETQIENANSSLAEAEKLIEVMRNRNIIEVPLAGQAAFPEAYAKVYWDKNSNSIYLDAKDLPEAPQGKVYQVWSLTLNPLTPTSLGTIDNFNTDANKIFTITNTNDSQAFGITLEPAGGSKTPTMEQLYTLGIVASVP